MAAQWQTKGFTEPKKPGNNIATRNDAEHAAASATPKRTAAAIAI
jgi:hypothetical protein